MTHQTYFLRVNELTPTRFWINNPTVDDARRAIAAGAISCTTNPTYAMKELQSDERDVATGIVDQAVRRLPEDEAAADWVQQELVARIMREFLPLHRRLPGEQGFVSIQGNPHRDTDAGHIVDEALSYRSLGPNFIAKIPVTAAGIEAISRLVAEGVPTIATEVMSLSQAVQACEAYEKASRKLRARPAFYLTHITGILDEYLQGLVRARGIDISPDLLWHAGALLARRQYRVFKERKYGGVMLGGGARGPHHFTEYVGSEMHITVNWQGTADKLIEQDPVVSWRMQTAVPDAVVEELRDKIPDFRRAWDEDGLAMEEFENFGPVVHFRGSFIKGWDFLNNTIKERREKTK